MYLSTWTDISGVGGFVKYYYIGGGLEEVKIIQNNCPHGLRMRMTPYVKLFIYESRKNDEGTGQ